MKNKTYIIIITIILVCLILFLNHSARLKELESKFETYISDKNKETISPQNGYDAVKTYIGEGEIQKAIVTLIMLCKESSPHFLDEAILIQGRVANFMSTIRKGIIKPCDEIIERNELSEAILSLSQEINI